MSKRTEKIKQWAARAKAAGFTDSDVLNMMNEARAKEKAIAPVEIKQAKAQPKVLLDINEFSDNFDQIKDAQDSGFATIKDTLQEGLKITNLEDIDTELPESVIKDLDAIRGNTEGLETSIKGISKELVRNRKETQSWAPFVTGLFAGLTSFLSRLANGTTFKVQPSAESFTTPQMSVLYDPTTKSVMSISQIMDFIANTRPRVSVSVPRLITEYNSAAILAALEALGGGGATSVGSGNGTVTTSGTPVQLSAISVPCKKVVIYNSPANGGLASGGVLVVGDSGVVAAEATRKGATLFPANGMEFTVANLNLLYLDSTDDTAKFNYYYEN